MPRDNRRFNGPEDSVSYKRFTKEYLKSYTELYEELIDEQNRRKDGRALTEARSMFAAMQVVSQAKGSAYLERDKAKVICSVFDPREIPHQYEYSEVGQIFCEVKFATFCCPRKRVPPTPNSKEKALSVELRMALEPAVCRHLFPNYQIDVFVYVLEHDGACLANAINAAGLALADAAVPMYDIITAASVAVIDQYIFVDPTEAEEHLANICPERNNNHGIIIMSMMPELKEISNFTHVGLVDGECLTKAMDILEEECRKMVPNVQKVLVANLVKEFETRQNIEQESKEKEQLLNATLDDKKVTSNTEQK